MCCFFGNILSFIISPKHKSDSSDCSALEKVKAIFMEVKLDRIKCLEQGKTHLMYFENRITSHHRNRIPTSVETSNVQANEERGSSWTKSLQPVSTIHWSGTTLSCFFSKFTFSRHPVWISTNKPAINLFNSFSMLAIDQRKTDWLGVGGCNLGIWSHCWEANPKKSLINLDLLEMFGVKWQQKQLI